MAGNIKEVINFSTQVWYFSVVALCGQAGTQYYINSVWVGVLKSLYTSCCGVVLLLEANYYPQPLVALLNLM